MGKYTDVLLYTLIKKSIILTKNSERMPKSLDDASLCGPIVGIHKEINIRGN